MTVVADKIGTLEFKSHNARLLVANPGSLQHTFGNRTQLLCTKRRHLLIALVVELRTTAFSGHPAAVDGGDRITPATGTVDSPVDHGHGWGYSPATMPRITYRVELDLFSGPLDLLLYLVRRNELDVRNLLVSQVVEQFLEYLDILKAIDLDIVGDFIVMAGTLAEYKSRLVLPQQPDESEPDLDDETGIDLIPQIIEYRKFKEAARLLEDQAAEWQERFPRLSNDRPPARRDASQDKIKHVELWDLVSALSRVLKLQDAKQQSHIRYDDTPIPVYIDRISQRVRSEKKVAFTSLFGNERLRSKIIGMFLAILELLRHHSFRAAQDTEYGEIWILPPIAPPADESGVNDPLADDEPTAIDPPSEG